MLKNWKRRQATQLRVNHTVSSLTNIPQALVGYEIVDSQRGVGYNYLISNNGEWNNCFMKNAPKK